jgi:hypothetical protein
VSPKGELGNATNIIGKARLFHEIMNLGGKFNYFLFLKIHVQQTHYMCERVPFSPVLLLRHQLNNPNALFSKDELASQKQDLRPNGG